MENCCTTPLNTPNEHNLGYFFCFLPPSLSLPPWAELIVPLPKMEMTPDGSVRLGFGSFLYPKLLM